MIPSCPWRNHLLRLRETTHRSTSTRCFHWAHDNPETLQCLDPDSALPPTINICRTVFVNRPQVNSEVHEIVFAEADHFKVHLLIRMCSSCAKCVASFDPRPRLLTRHQVVCLLLFNWWFQVPGLSSSCKVSSFSVDFYRICYLKWRCYLPSNPAV